MAHDRPDGRPVGPNYRSVWILAVECDHLAMAAATVCALAVMAFNTFVLELSDGLLIVFRAVVTFAVTWLAVIVLLILWRNHIIQQMHREAMEEAQKGELPDYVDAEFQPEADTENADVA